MYSLYHVAILKPAIQAQAARRMHIHMNIRIRENQSTRLCAFNQAKLDHPCSNLVDPLHFAVYATRKFANRHFARANFPRALLETTHAVQHRDTDPITCLSACVLKPEHREWMGEIRLRLKVAADETWVEAR